MSLVASLWLPERPERAPAVLLCLPGGNMNRRYFNLMPPALAAVAPPDAGFSFAARMTARGFLVAALDYLGCGDSDHPADGWTLTPEYLTRANATAVAELLARLREGRVTPELAALPDLPAVGVGHSMGAMMTILLQAYARPFAGLALLGFSTRGMPDYVPEALLERAGDPVAARACLRHFAEKAFGTPYPRLRASADGARLFHSGHALPGATAALKPATGPLLALPGMLSMVPGNVAPEAATLDVPLFLAAGDHDIVGLPQAIPAAFPASADLTLTVLPETGHSHFLFAGRGRLYARLTAWLGSGLLQSDGVSSETPI